MRLFLNKGNINTLFHSGAAGCSGKPKGWLRYDFKEMGAGGKFVVKKISNKISVIWKPKIMI